MRPHGSRVVGVFVVAVALVFLGGCAGAVKPLQADDGNGGWTPEFTNSVHNLVEAVEHRDAAALTAMNSSDGTAAGVAELLQNYGGHTLAVTSYDTGMQSDDGEGFANISVTCPSGTPQSFLQPFDSTTGQWKAVVYSGQDYPAPTTDVEPPSTGDIPAATSAGPTDSAAVAAAEKYGLYLPCS